MNAEPSNHFSIRPPAVAGSFYPESPSELKQTIQTYLAKAQSTPCQPKALIVPHAGYIYSGLTAAYAYKTLLDQAQSISRVVLLGPDHRVGFRGIAAPDCTIFKTPLGDLDVDAQSIEQALTLPYVSQRHDAHQMEHSLEVQLPFLQMLLQHFTIAPFVVSDASDDEVAALIELLWGGAETLFVISSDLSHYHDYQHANIIDTDTTRSIEQLKPRLKGEQACGCRAINGLLHVARRHHLHIQTLDLRNSGDTAGPKERVVGYGAYALQ